MFKYLIAISLFLSLNCFAYQTLLTTDEYIYEVYEPKDRIPADKLMDGLKMYYQAYLTPNLHLHIPLCDLKIDETRFRSYDEFIGDMFIRDFLSYHTSQKERTLYFQVRYLPTDQVVCLSVLLKEDEPGYYYMDHIGTHVDFRRQGLAYTLIEQIKQHLAGFSDIALDTRVFNRPAQALYEKAGFRRMVIHPVPKKQNIYYHYVYNVKAARKSPSLYSTESK